MAILANRVKTKNVLVELVKVSVLSIRKLLMIILMLISVMSLYFSPPTVFVNLVIESTGNVLGIGALLYKESVVRMVNIADRFVRMIDLETENLKLKSEILALKEEMHKAAILKLENDSLRVALNVVTNDQSKYLTTRMVGLSLSPFSSLAMIEAGRKSGVAENSIVRTEQGLIGRVVELGDNYAKVMLVNDQSSRIPVITESSKERGILAKQGDRLKIIYTTPNNEIKPGEVVYTSGDGKIYPYGVRVAVVEAVSESGVFVRMAADIRRAEFVIVELKE